MQQQQVAERHAKSLVGLLAAVKKRIDSSRRRDRERALLDFVRKLADEADDIAQSGYPDDLKGGLRSPVKAFSVAYIYVKRLIPEATVRTVATTAQELDDVQSLDDVERLCTQDGQAALAIAIENGLKGDSEDAAVAAVPDTPDTPAAAQADGGDSSDEDTYADTLWKCF